MQKLSDRKAQLVIAQSDAVYASAVWETAIPREDEDIEPYDRTALFYLEKVELPRFENLRLIASLFQETVHIIALQERLDEILSYDTEDDKNTSGTGTQNAQTPDAQKSQASPRQHQTIFFKQLEAVGTGNLRIDYGPKGSGAYLLGL